MCPFLSLRIATNHSKRHLCKLSVTSIMPSFSLSTHFSTALPSPYYKSGLIRNPLITLRPNNNTQLVFFQLNVSASNDIAASASAFEDPRWLEGTWDLKQFQKNGNTDWDAVIDAEVRRRKWLGDHPESSTNDNPVVFNSAIIPWWAWIKRFHLPEAELLNGRAAMIGFFVGYLVDSLTGVGVVDQVSNFFCKTLLFTAVAGILVVRRNEDIETLKKLWQEITLYDKQWQATWQDENSSAPPKTD